jgi:diguanylate cyclase (GGDEF)-like protein
MSRGNGRAAERVRENVDFAFRLVLWSAALSLVSYLSAWAQPNQGYVPIWPSGGIGLALVWRHGARYWPAIVASGMALSMSVGTAPAIAVGVGALQLLIVMVTVKLLQRWNVSVYLSDMRQLSLFILALFVATALAVPIYGVRMAIVFQYPPLQALAFGADYFLSALLSFLIFTPLLVSWPAHAFANRARLLWFAGGMAAIAIAGWCVLLVDARLQDRLVFLLLPFVAICALAARIGGASAASALLAGLMIAMARIPVPVVDSIMRTLFALIAAVTGYLLAAVFTERGRNAAEMDYRAKHDSLTGLMNRYEFENRVVAALHDTTQQYELLYLDLDQFKLINDTCGHLAGDHMLRQIARTIRSALPAEAVLARLGGDEFGCLLAGASSDDALAVAEQLHAAIRGFEFSVGALRFKVGVSIGATSLVAQSDRRADDALARADVACYAAKESGRNRTRLYSDADSDMHGRHSDIQRISQLLSDLSGGMFELHAQRIINLRDPHDGVQFYEVLLRRKHQREDESIEAVLDMAQRYGLLAQVDRWVLDQAAQFLGNAAATNLRLSVNIGATTLDSEGFQQFALALPTRYGFSAARIVLEITEAVAVKNLTHAGDTLRSLRERGYEIALDDFGAGVASFGYLSDLPVSMVKIDGRFVRDFDHDPTAEVVVESLTRVASIRGIRCVAEWVENPTVLPRLRELGIGYAQGFAIHRPVPLSTIELDTVQPRVAALA